MIKRKRKVIAAVLIAATVCASGTFAYFNSTVDMNSIANGGAIQKLDITNGYIKVTGKFNQTEGSIKDWSYDVARLSTNNLPTESDDLTKYININRSPDIKGFGTDEDTGLESGVEGQKRLKVGTPLTGEISQARPGDSIVLGDASDPTKTGITIKNETNLTCKAKIQFKESTGTTSVANQLTAMKNAGWKMYLNGTEIDLSAVDSGVGAINTLLATQATALAAGTEQKIDIRFELPLLADNTYQNKTNNEGGDTSFDLSNILDIVVTQENNPGWNNDGTTTNPATSTPNNGVTP